MTEKIVLFYQHFGQPKDVRGAHYKTYDFYRHIESLQGFKPYIVFDKESYWHKGLPWYHLFNTMPTLDTLTIKPDILFLNSGKDWLKLSQYFEIPDNIPIISPVNHFKAVNPKHPAFKLLHRKAIRLCPSPELYQAVKGHSNTRGPCLYIPNGVHIPLTVYKSSKTKHIEVLVVGQKNPEMAQQLFEKLSKLNIKVKLIDKWIDKDEFQHTLAASKISIHLPKKVEAHYIPAIESMMLKSLVIMPNCVGNETYTNHQQNCVISEYSVDSFYRRFIETLNMSEMDKKRIINNAKITSHNFTMEQEKKHLKKALDLACNQW